MVVQHKMQTIKMLAWAAILIAVLMIGFQVDAVRPGETVMIPTGVATAIPQGLVGLVYARSGLASKRGLAPANKVGVIDSDYRGEIFVALHNHGTAAQVVEHGERVAQLVLTPYVTAAFQTVESLDDTVRGAGGFGSTGK